MPEKKIAAFFDVDGTLTTTRVWESIMAYFRAHHLRRGTHLRFLLTHYPLYFLSKMGLLDTMGFRKPWAEHLVWYVKGFTEAEGERVWRWAVNEFLVNHWRTDSRKKLQSHLDAGHVVILVSASPAPLLRWIGQELGVTHALGTEFLVQNGRYTGKTGPVCIGEQKGILPKTYLQEQGIEIDYPNSYAYADSVTDMGLFAMVGHPIATHPDDELRSIAEKEGWAIFPK